MSDVMPPQPETHPVQLIRKSRNGLWWGIGSGVLVLGLVAAAAIVIPRLIHAERVATYTELVGSMNGLNAEIDSLHNETQQRTVLFALQHTESEELVPEIEELADMSDHYFTDADRALLGESAAALTSALEYEEFDDDEQAIVDAALQLIESDGYVWQTDFLNLSHDATEVLLKRIKSPPILAVADEDVTKELVEETSAQLSLMTQQRDAAVQTRDAAETRAANLVDAVAATLVPLTSSALGAPAQAEVVLDMYPNASGDSVEALRESAQLAADSVSAELFMYDDPTPLPVLGETPEDVATFAVVDAWRAVIITKHLADYSDAITVAWITDAGSLEDALGFNPGFPFIFF